MALSDLLQWWNLIFVLPFVGAVVYILALGVGVIGHDVDGAVDSDAGDHLGHDAPGGLAAVFDLLGVGRVPLAIEARIPEG